MKLISNLLIGQTIGNQCDHLALSFSSCVGGESTKGSLKQTNPGENHRGLFVWKSVIIQLLEQCHLRGLGEVSSLDRVEVDTSRMPGGIPDN